MFVKPAASRPSRYSVKEYARALGLERVLVTCDTTNTGSRKVI
jgi:predicted acetyltransferase